MAGDGIAIPLRLLGFAVSQSARGFAASIRRGPFARWRWPGPAPESLRLAPQDIRTNDPTLAVDFYMGIFTFAGKSVETSGRSIFEMAPPSAAFARELHGFAFLRHMRAAQTQIARENARSLVADWLALEGRHDPAASQSEVVARRVISWVSHSPLILEGADLRFYREFLRSLTRQVKRLHYLSHDIDDGYPRLLAAIAVLATAAAVDGQGRLMRQAAARLETELSRQIFADGGHISRHPGVLLDLLADLLPLAQAIAARGESPPAALVNAIDRMMPMLRFFRHRDGALGHFNGMGGTAHDLLATVLAYDEVHGQPVRSAIQSGYQRLEMGESVVLVDCGKLPDLAVSTRAHAGTLSFEFSSGAHRIVVNCGSIQHDERWSQLSRSTAAHSTLIVEETSTAHIVEAGNLVRRFGPMMLRGPRMVGAERQDRQEECRLVCRHDGYDDRFGLWHERSWSLSAGGDLLIGQDRLLWTGEPRTSGDRFHIRFHLHPAVQPTLDEDGRVVLALPDGSFWSFSATPLAPELAESVFLDDTYGPRRTFQIVVSGEAHLNSRIDWWLERLHPAAENPPGGADETVSEH